MKELRPVDNEFIRFLKSQVSHCENEANRRDAEKDASIKLHMARKELSDFQNKLRQQGYKL